MTPGGGTEHGRVAELDVTMTADLELAAHHEAGHALAAVVTGCEIGFVTVGPRGAGWTRFRPSPSVPPARARFDAIRRHLAGAAGEALFLNLAALPFLEVEERCTGGSADFAAARLATGLERWEAGYALSRAWRGVVELLEARRSSLDALARALQREGTIEGRRAVMILRLQREGESR